MQRIAHLVTCFREIAVVVGIGNVHAASPVDDLFLRRLVVRSGQTKISEVERILVFDRDRVLLGGQVDISGLVRYEDTSSRRRELVCSAAQGHVVAILYDIPEAHSFVVEQPGAGLDRRIEVGVNDLAILDAVLFQVAGPADLGLSCEGRQVQVVQRPRTVECIHRHGGGRERERTLLNRRDNLEQCQRQLVHVIRLEVLAARCCRGGFEDRQRVGECDRVCCDELNARLGGDVVGIKVLGDVIQAVTVVGTLTGGTAQRIEPVRQVRCLGLRARVANRLTVRKQHVVILRAGVTDRCIVDSGRRVIRIV